MLRATVDSFRGAAALQGSAAQDGSGGMNHVFIVNAPTKQSKG
jgi:hypothetical protein